MAQTILALPYIVALTAAAIQGLPPGLLAQARMLGRGPGPARRCWRCARRRSACWRRSSPRSARRSSEVGAVIIVGGNIQGYDQTLASALLQQVNDYANYPYAVGISLVLLALIVLLMGTLTVIQQRSGRLQLRFRDGLET